MRKYRLVAKKGEGTFSEVIKAQNIKTGTFHAIKCMKSTYTSADQVNSLREIQAIKRLSPHPNIITLDEVLFDPPSGRLALVFELLEGNLYELMKDRRQHFDESTVKSFMRQICTALSHMHAKGVFHRDIKPENILVDKRGKHLKLADFGSVRGINSKPPFTEYISTRWYRPPECLLTCGMYGKEMDIWGAGCIMFELSALYPLFPGSDEADQIYRIHSVLGTPNASIVSKLRKHAPPQASFTFPHQEGISLSKLIPSASETYLDLLTRSIAYDAPERITAEEALKHPYFVGDDTFPSATVKGKIDATKTRSSRAKITSFVPNPTKVSELKKAPETVQATAELQMTKPRSMVSILLARNKTNEIAQESRARNSSFNRKAYIHDGSLHKERTANRSNLPKLKTLIPENKSSDDSPSHKKNIKFSHIRSSGYGSSAIASTESNSGTFNLPSLHENHGRISHGQGGTVSKKAKLPPLGRDFR